MPVGAGDRAPTAPPAVTVARALELATARLARAGIDSPRLDAELLLAEVLGGDRARLVIAAREPVKPRALAAFRALLDRREAREPVAYILGRRGFRHLELSCDRRALIPRPETELLVEIALTLAPGQRVLDVGTGTGAVALAVKHERPDLRVTATDASEGALALATENARALGLDVTLVAADLRGGVACDALLANLPYVPAGTPLAPEITEYEPAEAVFGGPDGLAVIRRLCAELDGVPVVALEHGFDQAAGVRELLAAAGFEQVDTRPDLAGHDRVTVGRR